MMGSLVQQQFNLQQENSRYYQDSRIIELEEEEPGLPTVEDDVESYH